MEPEQTTELVWKEEVFSEAVEVNPKRTLKKGTISTYVSMSDLAEYKKKIQNSIQRKYNGGSKFKNGDTIMARITPCLENGKTAYVDILKEGEVGWGSTEFIVLNEKENITTSEFVYYLSISPKIKRAAIKSMTGTSGRQRVDNGVFDQLKIKLPTIDEQEKIVDILSSLDTLIEVNNLINSQLEKAGQLLFKHWFVDFEFPNEDGKPYKSNGGELVDSELGKIPKGWNISKFRDIIQINNKSHKPESKKYCHYSIPAFDSNNFPEIENGSDIKSNKYIVQKNAILLSKLNPRFFRLWLPIDNLSFPSICSTEFIVFLPKNKNTKYFCYELINSEYFRKTLQSVATGTTGSRQRVRPNQTLEFDVVIPPKELMEKFNHIAESNQLLMQEIILENQKLSKARDTLLPKLMSGEIRV